MKYEIWNGQTSINNIGASEILERRKDLKNNLGDIFLVLDDYNKVNQIEIGSNIKSKYNMPIEDTLEQVAIKYIEILNNDVNTPTTPQEPTELEQMKTKVSILETENQTLKASLQTTQQAIDFVLMGGI